MSEAAQDNVYYKASDTDECISLTASEIARIRQMLGSSYDQVDINKVDSDYSEFPESTHAWAVFADKETRSATPTDRFIGTLVIAFQMFTYGLFVVEAIKDYQSGTVPVEVPHDSCLTNFGQVNQDMTCEANFTSHLDAFVAFSMLSLFLAPDFLQAIRAIKGAINAGSRTTVLFAALAGLEVVCAYVSATIAVSYQLYIGEITDAIEVGVGLLFVRELSSRAYQGIRHKGVKQYASFFVVLVTLLVASFLGESILESHFESRGGNQ